MQRTTTSALILSTTLAAAVPAAGAEEEISTDRPDFVESSLTVGKNRFQVETSVAFEKTKTGQGKEYVRTTPTLLRYGIADALELRLETDGAVQSSATDFTTGITERNHGWSDISVGLKWHTRDSEGGGPSVAWLFHADIDSGSAEFRGQGIRPSIRATFEWELPGEWSIGVMPGFTYDKDQAGRFVNPMLAVVVGRELTERLRVFGEVAGRELKSSRHGGSVVTYDAGVAYLLTKNMQVDAAVSFGANPDSPDRAATAGFSIKF